MTQQRPGAHPDELISASLTGELSEAERAQLAVHLADCEICRQTMAAFAEGRRLVSGMRHAEAPRDLGPRVRAGIESGRFGPSPWWRRPGLLVGIGASLATATAAIMAVLVFSNLPRPPVASTGTPAASTSASADATPAASASLDFSPPPSEPAASQPTDVTADPNGHFVYTLTDRVSRLQFKVRQPCCLNADVEIDPVGPPATAALSRAGSFLAFRVDGEVSDRSQFYAGSPGRAAVDIGDSATPRTGFGAQLAFSPNERYLAYTLTDPETGETDAWLFQGTDFSLIQLTDTGDAFAASWEPTEDLDAQRLWVSRAGAEPASYLVELPADGSAPGPLDLATAAVRTEPGIFLPLISPDGGHAIFWQGQMELLGGRWVFVRGGMPYLATATPDTLDIAGAEQLFPTLSMGPGGAAFESAHIVWGPDGDAYAVWDAAWTGTQDPTFPDPAWVYLGHVSNGEGITERQALDPQDLADSQRVIDVALSRDGVGIAVTVQTAPGSESGTYGPQAEIRVITRRFGNELDVVTSIGAGESAWYGPAVYGECCFSD